MTNTSLFSEFESVSSKAYKQKIQVDLKGASYNDTLLWRTDEGIDVKPFYHRDQQQNHPSIPGTPTHWKIGESIFIDDLTIAATLANKAVNQGAEHLFFTADKAFDYQAFFKLLEFQDIPCHFSLLFLELDFYRHFLAFAKMLPQPLEVRLDIIHNLVADGNWYQSMAEDHTIFEELLTTTNIGLTVDTRVYQNAGATMTQQLAYGLAHLNEYLNHCDQKGISIPQITFQVAVGTNYFFEIAKLRALRTLTSTLLKEYDKDQNIVIIAYPTRRNKTLYDYNTNMLRTTTECMSAVLGGANAVVNQPYDALYHKSNEFGQRISRNQLIVLKKESYFDAVSNPADGAYYIESLTEQLAQKALELFKNVEASDGFLAMLKQGTIQRKIKESAQKEQQQFDTQAITLLGTNKHPNPNDRMAHEMELYPFVKIKPRKTIIVPIIPKRLAETIEQDRLKTEH